MGGPTRKKWSPGSICISGGGFRKTHGCGRIMPRSGRQMPMHVQLAWDRQLAVNKDQSKEKAKEEPNCTKSKSRRKHVL